MNATTSPLNLQHKRILTCRCLHNTRESVLLIERKRYAAYRDLGARQRAARDLDGARSSCPVLGLLDMDCRGGTVEGDA